MNKQQLEMKLTEMVKKVLKEEKVPSYAIWWKMQPESNQKNIIMAYTDKATADKIASILNKSASKLTPSHAKSQFGVQQDYDYIT